MISQKQRDLTIFESMKGDGPTMVAAAFATMGDYLDMIAVKPAPDDGAELQFSYNGRLYKASMEPVF